MPNGTYGGVRGRETKVGQKTFVSRPSRFYTPSNLIIICIFVLNIQTMLKKNIDMDKKEIFNRIEYVVACVGAFAQRYNLSNMQAYAYLRRFTGIDFLLDCYAAEHTLSIDDAVSDLQIICQLEGGKI